MRKHPRQAESEQASSWQKKSWGLTRRLVDSPFYSLHELDLAVGGYCSLHFHRARANRFRIISAQVEIIEMFGPNVVRTMLGPDNSYDVPSLVVHMFAVYKSGLMIEEYYPDRGGAVHDDDIVRIVAGGNVAAANLANLPQSILHSK